MDIARPQEHFFMRYAAATAIFTLSVLMFLVVALFWHQERASQQAKWWVTHSYLVLDHIESLFSKCKDIVLARGGYLLTGNTEYLEHYQDALKDTPRAKLHSTSTSQHRSVTQEIALLKELTADNPTQQSNLKEMEKTITKLLKSVENSINTPLHQNNKNMIQKIDVAHTKKLMDQIRTLVFLMKTEENQLLNTRIKIDKFKTWEFEWFSLSFLSFFYLLMISSIYFYQRNKGQLQEKMLLYIHELKCNEQELNRQQKKLKASYEEIETSNEEMIKKNKALEDRNRKIQQQAEELAQSKLLIEEKAREIEIASQYKSEFMANMSHELRTPLNSLLILAKQLATNELGNLTSEQVEEIEIIYTGGLELLGLINEILDLAKVESGKISLTLEDIFIHDIVKKMQQQFMPLAKNKKLPYLIHTASDLPHLMHTDAQRLEQILQNLLSNAFKFTQKGSVTLEIRFPKKEEMKHTSLNYTHSIAFSVIDTGIGINSSKLKDIFEAFNQENGSIDRHYGGTGLGLTIARKFATLLGGAIDVSSEKGTGSCFTLILPLTLKPKVSKKRIFNSLPKPVTDNEHQENQRSLQSNQNIRTKGNKSKEQPLDEVSLLHESKDPNLPQDKLSMIHIQQNPNEILHGRTILIADDDLRNTFAISKILKLHGMHVVIADNGQMALEKLRNEKSIELVIMDIIMPCMNGYEAIHVLRTQESYCNLPVIALTTPANLEEQEKCIAAGANDYLTKPIDIEQLLALLRIWLVNQEDEL